MSNDYPHDNRDKKVRGREKKRKYGQGTRAYLHAVTNSIAKRAKAAEQDRPPSRETGDPS
jgi:hypothetical protein